MEHAGIAIIGLLVACPLAWLGVWWRRPWLPGLAAVLSLPVTLELHRHSDLSYVIGLVPVSLLLAAWSLHQRRMALAWLLTLPPLLLVILLAVALVAWIRLGR